MIEALYWNKLEGSTVKCCLCPHNCKIKDGQEGTCRARKNEGGKLFSENYSKVGALNVDPIEKKPLYHFFPGSPVLSIGTFGCNFRCEFCQNWQLAHGQPTLEKISGDEMVQMALGAQKEQGSIGVAYTYAEPLVWYEYVLEIAPKIQDLGQKNILVTNGFIEEAPFLKLLPFISAMNIDVKGFSSDFYKRMVKGYYEPVLKTAEIAKSHGCHVEITNLLIPGMNDSEEDIDKIVDWVASSLGKDTPIHFSKYFPSYKLNIPPTPLETLRMAVKKASKKLDFVYLGNVAEPEWRSTKCPACGEILIERSGFTAKPRVSEGKCKECGRKVNIILQ